MALRNMAVEIPPVRRTVRDPVTMDTLIRVSDDHGIPADTRSAIVVAFYLGFRPINLVSVKRSRATGQQRDRPLKWSDLRVIEVNGKRGYEVTVRKEKTAASHSGDYAPKLLLPAEPGLPCPVAALDSVGFRYTMRGDRVLFPFTTDKDLQMALQKHAEPGQHLTPYSLRIGAATQLAAAGLPMEYQRRAGNWASNKTADKYVRNSASTWKRSQKAFSALRSAGDGESKVRTTKQAHEPRLAARPGQIRQFPDKKTDMLLTLHKSGQWRGYFYCPVTGKRVKRPRARKPHSLVTYEPFKKSELGYMLHHTHDKPTVPVGELAADVHVIVQQLVAGVRRPGHPVAPKQPAPKPAAAGGGEN